MHLRPLSVGIPDRRLPREWICRERSVVCTHPKVTKWRSVVMPKFIGREGERVVNYGPSDYDPSDYGPLDYVRSQFLPEDRTPSGRHDPSGQYDPSGGGLWQALAISAIASAGLIAGWMLLSSWLRSGDRTPPRPGDRTPPPTGDSPSREDLIDELSDEEKQRLLDELSGHV